MTWPAPASRSDAVAKSILQHPAPIIYNEPESTSSTQVVEQRKRSYSAGLYKYTKHQWDDFRQDVQRRSSQSSGCSTDSTQSPRTETSGGGVPNLN